MTPTQRDHAARMRRRNVETFRRIVAAVRGWRVRRGGTRRGRVKLKGAI